MMTDKDLDEFRKEVGNKFRVPLNHEMFRRIADAPMWEREIFVWTHKRLHGCGSAKEKDEERSKWVVENTYEFEKDPCGDLFIIKSDTDSELKVSKEKLPDNSVTKALLNELKVRTFNGCEKGSVTSADKTRQKGMCAVTRKVESTVSRSAHRIPSSPSQEPKSEKILCVKCNKPIHIKDFGAIAKQGLYHGDCIVDELTQEPKEKLKGDDVK